MPDQKLTPEQIAAELVALQYARRLPLAETRCEKTIELAALNENVGRYYVTTRGDVRWGWSLRKSRRVSARVRADVMGDDA